VSFAKALLYFLTEAFAGLVRSWRISSLAVLTMALTLLLCGGFALVVQNLSGVMREWQEGLRVIVYLAEEGVDETDLAALEVLLRGASWVRSVEVVGPEEATARFRTAFPSLAEVTEAWDSSPFPTSYEASIDASAVERAAFDAWLEELRDSAAVQMVDADRDWLDQLAAILRVVVVAGFAVGGVFLVAAVLTAASILRLTAHLQREETAIMRLVGATEFYVRGPFFVGGLLQGLCGGLVAVLGLTLLVVVVRSRESGAWVQLVLGDFLGAGSAVAIVCLGGAVGLLGAVLSMRREGSGDAADA